MHSHIRIRSILGYSPTVIPSNRKKYIKSSRIWLSLLTVEIKKTNHLDCLCPNCKDTKCSSNCKILTSETSFYLLFCFFNTSRDSRHFKKAFLKKIQVTAHDLKPFLSSLVSQAPLLIFKHYIIHFNLALSGCWIRMWKSAGCKLKKIYIHCLLISAVTDLAVPMVNLNNTTGSCITYQFTSWEVWCMEIWFNRSQNCLVEGCGSWKLEAGFLSPPLPLPFIFNLYNLKKTKTYGSFSKLVSKRFWFPTYSL